MLGVQVPPLRRCRSASERRCRQIRLLLRQNHLRKLRVHRRRSRPIRLLLVAKPVLRGHALCHRIRNRLVVEPILTAAAVSAEELRWQLGGYEAYCLGHVQRDKEIVEEHRSLRASRRSKMGAH
ncbi:hypothetical protein ACFX15_024579 [Malus domestica]